MIPDVYILTYCRDIRQLYGSLFVFPTIRVGFPNARVHVIDNCSIPEARGAIREATEKCGGYFTQIEGASRKHSDFLDYALRNQRAGGLVFLDSDVCFWERVEDWTMPSMMAGRLIPTHLCETTGTRTHARLHTSFLWISDVAQCRRALAELQEDQFDFLGTFRPVSMIMNGQWHRWDTGAILYAALAQESYAFGEEELNAYDHLFCGSHLHFIQEKGGLDLVTQMMDLHRLAKERVGEIRGCWRRQEEYFDSRVAALRELDSRNRLSALDYAFNMPF